MSRYRKFTTICCAAVFALGLAACGGGGNDGLNTSQEQELQNQVAMLQGQVSALRARLGIDDDSDPGHDVATLQTEIDRLEGLLKEKNDAEAAAMAKAMAAKLQKLATAIGAVDDTALTAHVQTTTAKPATATDGDAPHAISGWKGASYSVTAADKSSTMTVVYNDKAADTSAAFNKRFNILPSTDANAGKVSLTATNHGKLVSGISGLPTHPSHDGVPVGSVNGVRGALAGAAGTFTSESGTVTVGLDGDGDLTWTGGTLLFKPDSATATVMMPDTTYMNLGWWLDSDADGQPTDVMVAAWAASSSEAYAPTDFAGIIGKATFQGIAVGKYTHKTINSISGGHFNADAELVANFNDDTMTGTIDNFMQDGTPIASDWKVELSAAAAGDPLVFNPKTGMTITATGFTGIANNALGTFGTQKTMGTWDATFVDGTRNDAMPGGVVGTFHIGEESHPINMVGAFAASNREADQPKN